MEPARQIPPVMTLHEFLAGDAPSGLPWQLVDGQPRAMAPASRTHTFVGGMADRKGPRRALLTAVPLSSSLLAEFGHAVAGMICSAERSARPQPKSVAQSWNGSTPV